MSGLKRPILQNIVGVYLAEYPINDEWVIERVSQESSSFKKWLDTLLKDTKAMKAEMEEAKAELDEELGVMTDKIEKIKASRDLPSLKDMDTIMNLAMDKVKEKTSKLGSLGNILPDSELNLQKEFLMMSTQR